jgi:DNA-3-methyladenine glycosylase II
MLTTSARKVLGTDPVMAALIAAAGPCGLKPQLEAAPFEALARAIAHQQLNGTAAARILERFTALYAPDAFPSPEQLLATPESALRGVGFSFAKIRALRDLAEHTRSGVVPTAPELATLEDAAIIERLTRVRGVGRWTVEMLLIFQLGRRDVLSVDDFGVRNGFRLAYGLAGMPRARALAEFGERWRPHRTLATWYLWRAVDLARAEQLPAPPRRRPRLALEQRAAASPRKRRPRKTTRGKTAQRKTVSRARTQPAAPRRAGKRSTQSRRRTRT